MKEPTKIKLTNAPESKKVNLTPLPPANKIYLDSMEDDVFSPTSKHNLDIPTKIDSNQNENNQQNDS